MEPGGAVDDAARLLTVPFGAAAADALATIIAAAKAGDPLAPATVIVPGNLTGLALRRQLGGRPPGIVNVRFFVLDRLAELIGAGVLAAHGRRPLDDAVKAAITRQVLADRPVPLERVASAANTELAVIEFLDELAASGPDAVGALRSFSRRGAELAAIATRFRALGEPGFYDEHDLAAAAAGAIENGDADLRDVGQVILHLPHRLTHAALGLVDALAAQRRLWALVGLTGEPDADEVALALVAHLEPRLGPAQSAGEKSAEKTTVVSAPDAPGEVREAMRIVATELEAGRRLNRIGIVYRQREPYARLLDEELAAAGIPMHGPSVRTLAQTVAGRTLLGALSLADDDFSRVDVVRWMSASPIRFGGARIHSGSWSRVARKAGVVRGPEQWTDRLGALALETEAAPLAEFVAWLVAECGVSDRESWSAWSVWAKSFLEHALGSAAARRRWPEAELTAYDAVERIVDELHALVEVEPGPTTRGAALSHLSAMLSAPTTRRGRFGEGVFCGTLAHVVGVDLDVVIVLGMTEGSFPPSNDGGGVLTERERAAVGSPRAQAARAADERRTFRAALASAPARVLSWPRAGGDQVAHVSRWLEEEPRDGTVVIESFDAELTDPSGPPTSVADSDLRALRSCPTVALRDHALVRSDPALARGIACLEARGSSDFTEWEGRVGAFDDGAIVEPLHSATALEDWATCPARYFFKNVLRVREHEEIGDIDELEPRVRGKLVHKVLEHIGLFHLERFQIDDEAQAELDLHVPSWTETSRDIIENITGQVLLEHELEGGAPYPILWDVERHRILRDVLRTLASDDPQAILRSVEHRFGDDESPFFVPLPNGTRLRFKGTIDRVDELPDRLRVIDYKTGQRESKNEVSRAIARGTRLQLPLYGLAARRDFAPPETVDAVYWFVSAKGGWGKVTVPIDDAVVKQFERSLEMITTGISEGIFPANPGDDGYKTFDNCFYCDYARICPADRDRAFQRLADAPELARYLELAESQPLSEVPDE